MSSFDFYCEVAIPRTIELDVVYESESVLAFHHTKPSYERHIVVVPKKHIVDLSLVEDEDDATIAEIIRVCSTVLASWSDKSEMGAKVITNLGKFQDTPHLHFHVILGKPFV